MSQNDSVLSLTDEQINFEQRFNCAVCLCPRLKMVYGSCQHRLCVDCVYGESGAVRLSMLKCPICQLSDVFPPWKPDVLEDTVEIQKCLGVVQCPNCLMEMWNWELDDHNKNCKKRQTMKTPAKGRKTQLLTRSVSKSKSTTSVAISPRILRQRSRTPCSIRQRLRSFRK